MGELAWDLRPKVGPTLPLSQVRGTCLWGMGLPSGPQICFPPAAHSGVSSLPLKPRWWFKDSEVEAGLLWAVLCEPGLQVQEGKRVPQGWAQDTFLDSGLPLWLV